MRDVKEAFAFAPRSGNTDATKFEIAIVAIFGSADQETMAPMIG
jgi:hypothetical protein